MCLSMRLALECHFVLGLPSGSLEIPKIGIPTTLDIDNFVYRRPIKVKSKAKL
jgi:hypothetical protein